MGLLSNKRNDEYERGYQRGFDDGYVKGRLSAQQDQQQSTPVIPRREPFKKQGDWVTIIEPVDERILQLAPNVKPGDRVRVLRDFNNQIIGVIDYAGEASDAAE